jgi:hypothetical protein
MEESMRNCDGHSVNVVMLKDLHNVQNDDDDNNNNNNNNNNISFNNNKLNFSQSNLNVFLYV